MNRIFLIGMGLCLLTSQAISQILSDRETQQLTIEALKNIYDFDFKKAEPFRQKIRQKYPTHPVNPMLQAIQTYWQYLPLTQNPEACNRYQSYLKQAIQQAEKLQNSDKNDTEATFFLLSAHSYLAMLESDRKEYTKAVGEAKKTYNYMRKGFSLTDKNPEFYFPTGLYNYYRERYPEDHPMVKPVMLFFQNGNKAVGLKQMEIGYQKGIFTKTEAAYYLVYVLLKHENNPAKALSYSTPLFREYSGNPMYQTRHTEALTFTAHYMEAEPLAQQLAQMKSILFKTPGEVFLGIILEKGKKNDAAATAYYHRAIQNPMEERYTNDYVAMAYAGLGRIADRAGQKDLAKNYFKKAQKLAEYTSTKEEVKRYLK
ncbi:MAG: ABC transporter substrate-binding protein [Siphonobacter sp.]